MIGINAQIRSDSGTAEGVGFAVPVNAALRALEQLEATGKVVYPYVGIRTEDVTPGMAERFDLGAGAARSSRAVERGLAGRARRHRGRLRPRSATRA